MKTSLPAVEQFRNAVTEEFKDNRFVVFLCGPSLVTNGADPAAKLRRRLQDDLTTSGFDVVLGEDDGLEWLRQQYGGLADDNEISFITKYAGAVVVVANSVGSFCEIGLFSHMCFPQRSKTRYLGDLILIADSAHELDASYFNYGPAKSVDTLGGKLFYAQFDSFDTSFVIDRLKHRRAVWINKKFRR